MRRWIRNCFSRNVRTGAAASKAARWALLLLIAAQVPAHDLITTPLTWSREISRVVYQHCAGCHREAGSAFPLITYQDARPWAKAIRDEVLNRRMPPWDAVKGVGEFRGDLSLSPPEMDLIVNWVEGGAPEGNPDYLPARPPASEPGAEPVPPAGITLSGSKTLETPLRLAGIRPTGVLELAALLPDGAVRRLIWVRNFRPKWNRTYWLRKPLLLPKGSRLILTGASATLLAQH